MFRWSVIILIAALLAGIGLMAQTSRPLEHEEVPSAVCVLQDERIVEASGIVSSRRNPDCYYVHNDSGDRPRIFLVDAPGKRG